jgi:polyisoprenoid-binding protein YceI
MKANRVVSYLLVIVIFVGSPAVSSTIGPEKKIKKTVVKETTFTVDPEKSELVWIGKKITGDHTGPVKVGKGTLIVSNGQLSGGIVSVDLRTITSSDLKDNKEYHDKLVNHLKADDFFAVEKFPTVTFKITTVTPKPAGQVDLVGALTIKGITRPISFPATVKVHGNTLEATGKATIDRAKYGMKFRSKSFFENLGDKMIYDDFTLDLKIVANATIAVPKMK